MTSKFLNFYDFAWVAAPPFARANEYSSSAVGALSSRAADTRHIPRLRAPLECRWQIDPATGALLARWIDPATDRGTRASGERFRSVPAKWVFCAVSSDIDQVVARKVSQKDRARGILFQDEEQRITIWVKTWSQIVNDCKARKLDYTPDRDSSLSHLKTTYHKYLADLFAVKVEDVEPAIPNGEQLGRPPRGHHQSDCDRAAAG
jgi:hypothetical protein